MEKTVGVAARLIPAAQYVRMSTEHQRYSIAYQSAANAAFARAHGYEIVRTYSDEGISGLRIERRTALQQLLADVLGGTADFAAILTYDVSRWGRFQDPDQAAHYEFVCRNAGVPVVYCAEPFLDDGTLGSTLVKHLKRAMAAEYSRELSARISRVHRGMAAEGYWVGGPPGYGLRRRSIAPDGTLCEILERGRRKSVASHRTVLVPGPENERLVVQRIFRMFLHAGMSRAKIARTLNEEGILGSEGAKWTDARIELILFNEKYVGTSIYGKTSAYLGRTRTRHPRSAWQNAHGAFEPIVERRVFDLVERNAGRRRRQLTPAEMLAGLQSLLVREGRLSHTLINEEREIPCSACYRRTFGGLIPAYEAIGYQPSPLALWGARRGAGRAHRKALSEMSDAAMLDGLARLYAQVGSISVRIINQAANLPGYWLYQQRFGGMASIYKRLGYVPSSRQAKMVAIRSRSDA